MEKRFCEYDTQNCKIIGFNFITKKGKCGTHGNVFFYTRVELEKAYADGMFTRPSERNKKKELFRYGTT